jgi:hypothetical protein
MATTYETADTDVLNLIKSVVRKHHPDLHETGANIGAIFASNEDGPALKVHGAPAMACIQAVSAKRRPHCECDAEITIDRSEWNSLNPFQQEALIHHELSHLKRKEHKEKKLQELRKESPDCPAWIIDNLGRPKLGTVPAEHVPGDAFSSTIEIYGPAAIEFVGADRFKKFADEALATYYRNRNSQEAPSNEGEEKSV